MRILFITIILFLAKWTSSQNDSIKIQLKANADIASRYIWRGNDYFNSPAIQPDLELVYKNKIGIGAWGSISFANQPIQENDLFIFVNFKSFSVYFYDYFYTNQNTENQYFNYNPKNTGHTLSTDISYTISDNIPLTILASYNFWGNDTLHSGYLELSYAFKKEPVRLFCGATNSNGWYGNTMGIVNAGFQFLKTIKISDNFELPIDFQCIINPQKENLYLVAIIHL